MPEVLDRCVEELKRKGYSESQAWAICTSIYRPSQSITPRNLTHVISCDNNNRIVEGESSDKE